MNIFFDLDGTLFDSRIRLYQLFQDLAQESTLSFEEYWNLKRDKISNQEILSGRFNYSTTQVELFTQKWMDAIESEHYLLMDTPFNGVEPYLRGLRQNGHNLFVVTARQDKKSLYFQLNHFRLKDIFSACFVTEQKNEKSELIKPYLSKTDFNIMIGDTGKDVETGHKLSMYTVAVLSGFLSNKSLLPYQPHLILNNVIDFNPQTVSLFYAS